MRLHERDLRLPALPTEGNEPAPNLGEWTVRDLGERVGRGHLDGGTRGGPLRARYSPWRNEFKSRHEPHVTYSMNKVYSSDSDSDRATVDSLVTHTPYNPYSLIPHTFSHFPS